MSQASHNIPFSPIKFAPHCVLGALQHKALSGSNDYVGLFLYNVGNEDGSSGFNGINVVLNMELPDVSNTKRLGNWLDDMDFFERKVGSAKDSSLLSDVTWACTDLLTNM